MTNPDTPDKDETPHAHPEHEGPAHSPDPAHPVHPARPAQDATIPPPPPPMPPTPPVPPAPPAPPIPPPPVVAAEHGFPAPEPTPQAPVKPVPPVPPTPPAPTPGSGAGIGAATAAAGAGAAAGGYVAPPPPPPLTPPGPPLNPPGGGGSVYGRAANRMNLLGYLAVAFGIIGTGCCCCPWLNGAPLVGGIPAIILGFLHLSRVRKGQASQSWLGWLGIALGVLALLGAICGFATDWDTRITDEYQRQFGDF